MTMAIVIASIHGTGKPVAAISSSLLKRDIIIEEIFLKTASFIVVTQRARLACFTSEAVLYDTHGCEIAVFTLLVSFKTENNIGKLANRV